jgi:hypothetical protein
MCDYNWQAYNYDKYNFPQQVAPPGQLLTYPIQVQFSYTFHRIFLVIQQWQVDYQKKQMPPAGSVGYH